MFDNLDDPRQQALLAAAFGLLGGQGGKGFGGFARDAGRAGLLGMQSYNQASALQDRRKEEAQQRKFRELQMGEMQRGMDYNKAFGQAIQPAQPEQNRFALNDPNEPGMYQAPKPQGIDWAALQRVDPRRALADQQAFNKTEAPLILKADEAAYSRDGKLLFGNNKPKATFRLLSAEEIKARGLPPGQGFQVDEATGKLSAVGSQPTNISIDNKYGGSLKSELGKGTAAVLNDGRVSASAARDSIVQGHQIMEALDQGGAYTGPGASVKLKAAQIAPLLGFKGDAEGVTRTRAVITGLANQTINARGLLKGQGQITEYEQKTLEKAKSGNIDDMTADEIRTVIGVNERVSRAQIGAHTRLVTSLGKKPDFAEIVPFYQVEEPGAYGGAKSGKRKVYNPETGMIEDQ